ncbi:uncharacterized protein DNG_03164 [Cephalotrichum gorgonifer]|uniref:Uncharacterized protein n=1 Tax=Cephalotrichum gorgonifer TaxID=2041049 RepID=A0AAE8STQ5_9PEZI|nr:uncharacterized protein DNG_03164 [Cephalotrichum gorgonifer]
MAFAARHRSLTDPRWTWPALSMKGRAVAALRQRLGLLDTRAEAIADPQIPVAMMFLCLDEILDSCDHRWVIHMRACQDWLRLRRQLPSSSRSFQAEQSLVSFAERFFAFQDVISRTACGKAPHFGLEYWEDLGRGTDAQEWWMGCSTALANIIFRITELGRARDRKELSADTFEMQAGSLEEELQSLTYKNHQDYDGIPGDGLIRTSFELMRESVTLYHHCLLYDASPSTPLVATAIRKILQMTHELMEAGSFSGLAFPLFVAAVELDPLNDELILQHSDAALSEKRVSGRWFVLETLQTLSVCSLFNVPRTRAVIRNIWTMRDLRLEEDEATRARNDWNFYVSPYSSNISLA